MSGQTKRVFYVLLLAVLPLLMDIGYAGGNTVKIVMAVLMSLAMIGLIYFAVATVVSDLRAREDEGAL